MKFETFDAIVLAPCPFALDPRHEYWVTSLERLGFNPLRVEVVERTSSLSEARTVHFDSNFLSVKSNRKLKRNQIAQRLDNCSVPTRTALGKFLFSRLSILLDAVSVDAIDSLNPEVIIANDLFGILVAYARWGHTNATIVYDAQEVFTDSYDLLDVPQLSTGERMAWIDVETKMCQRADLTVTVSPGLATLYKERHGVECAVLPNFAPTWRHASREDTPDHKPKRFVFVGRADPQRGLEQLVTQWNVDESIATLDMIMPDTRQSRRLQLLSKGVARTGSAPNFVPPVGPSEIIETLTKYDVGILPYSYPYPYSHASPNKFGEYVAAGLPVIANDQPFVSAVIKDLGIGQVFDWLTSGQVNVVAEILSDDDALNRAKENVKAAAIRLLNWEVAGHEVWNFLQKDRAPQEIDREHSVATDAEAMHLVERARAHEQVKWRIRARALTAAEAMAAWVQVWRHSRTKKFKLRS